MEMQHLYRLMFYELNMDTLEALPADFYYEGQKNSSFVLLPGNGTDCIWNGEDKRVMVVEHPDKCQIMEINDTFWGIHFSPVSKVKWNEDKLKDLFCELQQLDSFERRLFHVRKDIKDTFTKQKIHPVLQKAVEEIERTKGLTGVEDVRMGMDYDYSLRQLERIFKEVYSYGPKQFCRKERILFMVEYLLQHSGMQVQRGVEQAGYSDRSHFQREFQHFFNMTPVEFLESCCHKETIVF